MIDANVDKGVNKAIGSPYKGAKGKSTENIPTSICLLSLSLLLESQ